PGAPLWHEAVASRDALAYVRAAGSPEEQEEAYRLLYPAYGTYVGGAVGDWVPGVGIVPYAGAVFAGHIAGRIRGRQIARQTRASQAEEIAGASDGQPTSERFGVVPVAGEAPSRKLTLSPAGV